MATRRPLRSRPLDLVYFGFFMIHIPVILLIDNQLIYPTWVAPAPLQRFFRFYVETSGDPFFTGGMGLLPGDFTWTRILVYLEAFFQIPVFVIAGRKLWQDTATPNTYLLLLIYGVSTTTAGLPLLALLLSTPIRSAETIAAGIHSIPKSEHFRMLCNYTPILLIPLMVAVDMAFRLSHSIQNRAAKEKVT